MNDTLCVQVANAARKRLSWSTLFGTLATVIGGALVIKFPGAINWPTDQFNSLVFDSHPQPATSQPAYDTLPSVTFGEAMVGMLWSLLMLGLMFLYLFGLPCLVLVLIWRLPDLLDRLAIRRGFRKTNSKEKS